MPPDLSSPVNDAANLRNIQAQRDRLRLLAPTPDDALWQPAVGRAQDFWRTLCARYLVQQNSKYKQAEERLTVLADAVQKCAQDSTRGLTLPLFRVALNPRFTRPFYAVPRTSAARTASG